MMRRILYLFLPDWPIDRLRRLARNSRQPLPSAAPADEAPLATVIASGGRRLLAAVNPAAAAGGLWPGMPVADALSFLPSLATVPADPAADQAALTRLAEWCGRYSPWTAPDGADGVKIEITGCAHLWGGEADLAADLGRRLSRQILPDNSPSSHPGEGRGPLFRNSQAAQWAPAFAGVRTRGIRHRIAIASTLGAAWALARFASEDAKPCLPPAGQEQQALAPLPVEGLRLDPATAAGLRRVGLKRVGDLLPMPRDALARRFGSQVALRLDQALDVVPEPLSPLGEPPVRRVRLSFAEPIADPADLAHAAERLADDLMMRLGREGLGARRLGLAFHRVDGHVEHIRIGTARPSREPRHIARLFTAKLDTIDPGFGIEDMILAVYAAEQLPPEQTGLMHDGGNGAADIAPLLDRLGARLGLDAIGHLAERASHIPERASCFSSAVIPGHNAGSFPATRGRRRAQRDGGGPLHHASHGPPPPPAGEDPSQPPGTTTKAEKPPRPIRLFATPEPIDAVMWIVPDDPPARFTWRRRDRLVQRADGPERIAPEWWLPGGSLDPDAIRDYYRVEDEAGRRFWLFRAGLGSDPPPRWFLHGVFA